MAHRQLHERVPRELLSHVFTVFCEEGGARSRILLLTICREWQKIGHATHLLWSEVEISIKHSHFSVDDAQAEHEDALRNTSSVLLSKPFEGPTNSSATISVLRVYQGLTSGVAQAQPVGYRDIVLPYYRLSPCLLQTPGSTFLVLEKGDSECDEVD